MSVGTLSAALAAGISATCLLLLIFQLLESVSVNKDAVRQKTIHIPLWFRFLLILEPNLRNITTSGNMKKTRENLTRQIGMAGLEQVLTGEQMLAIRILSTAVGAVLAILFLFSAQPLTGVILFGLLAFWPGLWLRSIVSKRHLEIIKALPNMLDLLTLSVEAGKDFLSALRDILEKRKMDALGEEFLRALHEIQLGKKRQDALREIAQRVRQPELMSVLSSIIQADEMGVSIGPILKIQSDQLRMKRFARAEKLANETPVKILFPVVVFIFPAVLILLMTPILMQAFHILG